MSKTMTKKTKTLMKTSMEKMKSDKNKDSGMF